MDVTEPSHKARWNTLKRNAIADLNKMVCDKSFEDVFDLDLITRKELKMLLKLAIRCMSDLIDTIVLDVCKGYVNYTKLNEMLYTCFIVALKVIAGEEWVYDDLLMEHVLSWCETRLCKKSILRMEIDIFMKTNWQPCKNL